MADVAILPPQDFLNHHNHHRRHNHHPNSTTRPTRRARRSPPPRPNSPAAVGPIRILKRGEDAPVLDPKPEIRPKSEVVIPVDGFYAGFGFVTSPPPSSVPLPAFFTAGRGKCGGVATTEADIATGLKRLLNLH